MIAFPGLFREDAVIYKPYVAPDALLSDLEAYKIHISFPINSAVAELRKSKGIAFTKVIPCRGFTLHRWTVAKSHFLCSLTRRNIQINSASTAVLWRPSRVLQPAFLILESFVPVVGLFGVVFIGCLLAGMISVLIELGVPDSTLYSNSPGSERHRELRTGQPLGRGFMFALKGMFSQVFFLSLYFCCVRSRCSLLQAPLLTI